MVKTYLALWLRVIKAALLSSLRSPRELTWLLPNVLHMARDYAVWTDFFYTNQVKLHVSAASGSSWRTPAEQALNDLGGLSLTYQRSLTSFATAHYATTVDVHFGFGVSAEQMHRKTGSHIAQLVTAGYIHDHGFVHMGEAAAKVRARMNKNGAKFVVCYLDENPDGDKRYSTIVHEDAAWNYQFLLEKAMEDPSLGLVFKSKKPAGLWQSLGPVAELLQRAVDSGRCVVYGEGAVTSPTLPAEAAAAADVAISLMLGGTAGFETRLAGIPSLLLDRDSINYHPLYSLGRGSVAFQSWDELWGALTAYRMDSSAVPGFGDWSSMIDNMDPFRDGRAAERIGSYVSWLANGLKDGLPREQVLELARQRYVDLWGEDKIVGL